MSTVDVIVPCYRYGHFLSECVESVLAQSGVSVRVLIIDDASPDGTAEVAAYLAQSDSRVSVLRHSINSGHIATYNEGIEWVSADFMLILSADDYLLPGALARAVTLMECDSRVGLTFGNAIVLTENGTVEPADTLSCESNTRIFEGRQFIALSGVKNIVCTPTAIVRATLQKRVGGYRPELPHTADMEMWLRLAAHAHVGFIGAPQAVYRRHQGNMSLSYVAQRSLPDLQQRKAALEYFFRTYGDRVPESVTLFREQLYTLSRIAVCNASSAFNDGKPDDVKRLSTFAVDTCPTITNSFSWIKLVSKQAIGIRTWRGLRPIVDGLRRVSLLTRRGRTATV